MLKSILPLPVESLFTQDDSGQLDDLIGLTFRETSRHVLEEILTRHKFMTHLRALRRYLLLGQGDFVRYLMEILRYVIYSITTRLIFVLMLNQSLLLALLSDFIPSKLNISKVERFCENSDILE